MTIFIGLLREREKDESLRAATQGQRPDLVVSRDVSAFGEVPGSPFAYWMPDAVRAIFSRLPPLSSGSREVKQGLGTSDDFRFVRTWWEVGPSQKWVTFAKGGPFSPYFAELPLVLNWGTDGHELRAFEKSTIRNDEHYFRPGLTWSDRTTRRFSARPWPAGGVFSVKGSAGFFPGQEFFAAAVMNSEPFSALLEMLVGAGDAAARSYQVGVLATVPFPPHDNECASLAEQAWSLRRALASVQETALCFSVPALFLGPETTLLECAASWCARRQNTVRELDRIQENIDSRCFELYGMDRSDTGIGSTPVCAEDASEAVMPDVVLEDAEENDAVVGTSMDELARAMLSWAVGCSFGRFNVRMRAAREGNTDSGSGPFDPLPVCSPGMLTGCNGLPLDRPPTEYELTVSASGVLVDDPGHRHDLLACVRAVFDLAVGTQADRWWDDLAATVSPNDHDLRAWFAKEFFDYHLRVYSSSRRRAPVYWQLATPSASYSVWVYSRWATRDTLFRIQNEFLSPKISEQEQQLISLRQVAGANPAPSQRREIGDRERFLTELRETSELVIQVAALWEPDLDDGAVLALAPLWRLFPQHKGWQEELRSRWEELAVGDHDWAHIAMHLWPERVVPKCADDRSFAIAHGLEEIFWVEDAKGKWQKRDVSAARVEELVRERTKPAVRAALASLMAASTGDPAPGRRGRKGSGR